MRQLRPPIGLTWSVNTVAGDAAEEQLLSDRDSLREIVAGLDRLESLLDQTPVLAAAAQRGYFTPDEDDRVRQTLLAYRNYRIGVYEIIFRYLDYEQIPDESRRLRSFLVGYAAALTLYEKTLKLIKVAEHRPLLRAKLNEPDAKYDLQAGFFDDALLGYSSPTHYLALANADRSWRVYRRAAFLRRLTVDAEWQWLGTIIRRRRSIVRRRLLDVLLRRLRYDWRAFWRTVIHPARQTRYGLQSLVGERFAGTYLMRDPVHVLTPGVLGALRPQLQPGDVLLCRAEGKLTVALLPGFWSHAAIYLGSRAELESLHVPEQDHAARGWEEMPIEGGSLGFVIEGVAPRVRICPLETCLHADHVLVLRPDLSRQELAAALGEAFGHLGKPYDYEFDFNVTSRIVCTELVYRCYHRRGRIQFPLVKRLGRFTLSGDDVMDLTLDELGKTDDPDRAPIRPVGLVLKQCDGQAHVVPPNRIVTLLQRIRAGWRPAQEELPQPLLEQTP